MTTARQLQRRRKLERLLDAAHSKVRMTRRDNYPPGEWGDRYYRSVLVTRERRVRQLEQLLAEMPAEEAQ